MKHIKVGNAQDLLDALDKTQERAFNPDRKYTRAQAEKMLSAGVAPELFTKHSNYHVRYKAWRKMGQPLPENGVETFLATLQGKEAPKDPALLADYNAMLRHRFLGEPLPEKEAPPTEG
jgi:hypothetical protein